MDKGAAARRQSVHDNFLAKFKGIGSEKLSADQFAQIWENYDTNDSGFIDKEGLDKFFRDYLGTMTRDVTDEMVEDLKSCYLGAYDEAKDGRFHVTELAEILPTDQNFLLIFRKNENITDSRGLLKLWRKYDTNKSGYIEAGQLKFFIRDLLKEKPVEDAKLDEYVEATLTICDKNGDGRLGLKEMARLLNIKRETNFLIQFDEKVKNMTEKEKRKHINKVFQHYASEDSDELEGARLDAFISDLMVTDDSDAHMDMQQLENTKRSILTFFDKDGDGKIDMEELAMCLGVYKGL
ncbi:secretagogin-like isoform X2 [Diadema antillarum]|uniref:secretagogin-like isoform X2 n=1 Tax=Diadema antillarum TaxID=105358 RepID=UPI003A854309